MEYYLSKGCTKVRVGCSSGSLVLWDSRTIHAGIQAQKGRSMPNYRLVAYVCMTPKSLASKATLNKRKKAFDELRSTSHLPHKVHLFPKCPRLYGNIPPNVAKVEKPVLTKLGEKLVC